MYKNMRQIVFILLIFTFISFTKCSPQQQLSYQIDKIVDDRSLRGIQISITKSGNQIFYHHKGLKNQRNQSINENTVFRISSLSKSFAVVAIMQLVQQGKLNLSDKISTILGYNVVNPNYPEIPITLQMVLSHQASIAQTQIQDNYDQFLDDTGDYSLNGSRIPSLKQILVPGGKYYNSSMFLPGRKPGQYFHYCNLCYIIAGTVIQIASQQRFDKYMQDNILDYLSQGLVENATYFAARIKNMSNIGTIYQGDKRKWVPTFDNYNQPITEPNLSAYKIGSNAGVFGPQGSIRGSVRHLQNYTYIFTHKGVLRNGKRLLLQKSVDQMLKPRFQYHGSQSSAHTYYNLYGLGLFTTSYDKNDLIIEHEVVKGHLGLSYGSISGYHFWKDYILCYIVNGNLNGYQYVNDSIYQVQRTLIHKAVNKYTNLIGQNSVKQQIKQKDQ